MRQVMHAAGKGGVEAAQPFVLAAGAGLEALHAALDRVIDRGVIADVEMQELEFLEGAPVTAVEDAGLFEIEGSGDQFRPAISADEAEIALEVIAHQVEELAREVLPAPVKFLEGREVYFVHRAEQRVGNFVAGERSNLDALARQRRALMTDRVAALALELRQVIVEGREAGVEPMVLVAEPFRETEVGQRRGLVSRAKVDVDRRELVVGAQLQQRAAEHLDHPRAIVFGCDNEAPSGMRSEGHSDQQLGEIADSRALGGVGPSVIEDELTLAMALQIERARRGDFPLGADAHDQMARRPSGVARRALGFLHRPQPVPIEKGRVVRCEQRVPILARHVADALDNRDIGFAGL